MKEVFIPGNIPSSKNSKVATSKGVFSSKAVGRFLREIGIQSYSVGRREVKLYKTKPCYFPYEDLCSLFKNIKYPCEVGIHFVRKNKSSFDFHNISQIVFDLLVAWKVIPDDSMNYVIPRAYKKEDRWFSVEKTTPGVYIKIIENDSTN